MAIETVDVEKGNVSANTRSRLSNADAINQGLDACANLQLFQSLVGIRTPQIISHDANVDTGPAISRPCSVVPRARNQNIGLYRRTESEFRSNRLKYVLSSAITNTLYMLQILLAAVFTAMSAYKDSTPITLTVLGAANTIIAGALAWQKGQGIPQRYRKAMDQYNALLLDIESAERAFLDPAHPVDPHAEHARLQNLFDTARADQQANCPDLYVSTGAATADDTKVLAKALDNAKNDASRLQSETIARMEELMTNLEGEMYAKIDARLDSVAKVST